MKDRIIALRKALGMTQRSFGESIGISDVSVSKIESGKNALTEQNIKLMSLVFGVNEEWLRAGKGTMFGGKSKEEQETELLTFFQGLTEPSRKMILAYIKHMYMLEHGHTLNETEPDYPTTSSSDCIK